MAYGGIQYTLTASAVKLTTALGLSAPLYAKQIDIKNAALAANNVYLGPSNVTNAPANARAELLPGQAFTFLPGGDGSRINTDDIFIVGTVAASNVAFISVFI